MMDAQTGRTMALKAHIAQSVKNILFTRLGTRVQREEYGSLLPELLDAPMTPNVIMMCYAAIVSAIANWEPRIIVQSVGIDAGHAAAAKLLIHIEAVILDSGALQTWEIEL